ncbi:MAG: hypothetical protein V4857_10795 [Pseudomonadota bacterium]
MNTVLNRLYSDYLMPSRLAGYERLLARAHEEGYRQLSVRDFGAGIAGGAAAPGRCLVHRHDIDSDLRTAAKMFALEQKHGVAASYYFRLSTLDFGLMREIEAAGSEASYHYEEVADFAKEHHLHDASEVRRRLPEIRERFLENYSWIESRLGRPMPTVASHGDFVNRRLQVFNHEILGDHALRARCGIAWETYDAALLGQFDAYISDRPHPVYFHPFTPQSALGRHARICLLTHPVQWETNWRESTRCNVRRLREQLAW